MIGFGPFSPSRRVVAAVGDASPDFSLSAASASTNWGTVAIGDLVPSNAPAGAYFLLVDEPAGLAVVNG